MLKYRHLMLAGVTLVLFNGCGKNFRGNLTVPAPSPSVQADLGRQVDQVPDFAKILIHSMFSKINAQRESFMSVLQADTPLVETEEYFNTTAVPVMLWVHTSGRIHTHTEYHDHHTTTTDGDGKFQLKFTAIDSSVSTVRENPTQWEPILLNAHAEVRLEWQLVMSGHVVCPPKTLAYSNTNLMLFQVQGQLEREVRVSPMSVAEPDATVASDFINPTQVYVLQKEPVPLTSSWGSVPDDVFRYDCFDGMHGLL